MPTSSFVLEPAKYYINRLKGKKIGKKCPPTRRANVKNFVHNRGLVLTLGSSSNDDGDGNKIVKKAIDLLSKPITSHVTLFCIFLCHWLHYYDVKIGQSRDFWRKFSSFVARVASLASKWSEGANDATRDTNKLYARQKSRDYHYYQYTRPNLTNLLHWERLLT